MRRGILLVGVIVGGSAWWVVGARGLDRCPLGSAHAGVLVLHKTFKLLKERF